MMPAQENTNAAGGVQKGPFFSPHDPLLPVDSALAEARTAIHVGGNNSLEWGTPVLFLRAPGSVLFELPALAPTQAALVGMSQSVVLPAEPAPAALAPTKTARLWVEKGLEHRIAGSLADALADYEQAIQLDPDKAAASLGVHHFFCEAKITQ